MYVGDTMLKILASWNRTEAFITMFEPLYNTGKKVYGLKSKKGFVFFGLRPKTATSVLLHSLRAQKPGCGDGTEVMKQICRYADKMGVTLTLRPNPGYGSLMDKPKLADWYRKFGFSGTDRLHRRPQ